MTLQHPHDAQLRQLRDHLSTVLFRLAAIGQPVRRGNFYRHPMCAMVRPGRHVERHVDAERIVFMKALDPVRLPGHLIHFPNIVPIPADSQGALDLSLDWPTTPFVKGGLLFSLGNFQRPNDNLIDAGEPPLADPLQNTAIPKRLEIELP
jgi:hypothetical protein